MKASYSFPLLFLFAAATCKDTPTAPETGYTAVTRLADDAGNPPPPPVDAAIVVCTSSGCAVFDGEYFADGSTVAITSSIAAAIKVQNGNDGICTFPGSAWLRIRDLRDDGISDADASANARIKCSHERATGTGTIEVGIAVVHLDEVIEFANSPDCAAACAQFTAETTVNGQPVGPAEGFVFEREFFEETCDIGEGGPLCDNGEGGGEID